MCPETKSQISIRVRSTTIITSRHLSKASLSQVRGDVIGARRHPGGRTASKPAARLLNQPCVLFEHETILLCPGSASHAKHGQWTRPCPTFRRPGTALTPTCHSNANYTRRGQRIFTVTAYSPTNTQRTTLQQAIAVPKPCSAPCQLKTIDASLIPSSNQVPSLPTKPAHPHPPTTRASGITKNPSFSRFQIPSPQHATSTSAIKNNWRSAKPPD